MKTNIATGTFILGTVYSHDNMLVIGNPEKGMAFNLKHPEGLHHVYGETNQYGELISIKIDFKNDFYATTDKVSLTKDNVLYGTNLNELTPDQVKQRLENQKVKCKRLIELIKMDGISLFGDNLNNEVNSLCKKLRLKRHELFDLLVNIFEEVEDQAEMWKVEYLMSHLSVNGGFEGGLSND